MSLVKLRVPPKHDKFYRKVDDLIRKDGGTSAHVSQRIINLYNLAQQTRKSVSFYYIKLNLWSARKV